MYGNIYHPETGKWLASVEGGKVMMKDGKSHKLDGNKVVDEDGNVLCHLSPFIGKAVGSGALATKVFGRG
jgi:hypothetical protein